jgi:Mrp family chromosome partitioning ATPase
VNAENPSFLVGVVQLPSVAAALTAAGYEVVTGDDYRTAATTIRNALAEGATQDPKVTFPVIVSDEHWPGLRPWATKIASETDVVIVRTDGGDGREFDGTSEIALPSTLGAILATVRKGVHEQFAALPVSADGTVAGFDGVTAAFVQQATTPAAPVAAPVEVPVAPAQPVAEAPVEAPQTAPVAEQPVAPAAALNDDPWADDDAETAGNAFTQSPQPSPVFDTPAAPAAQPVVEDEPVAVPSMPSMPAMPVQPVAEEQAPVEQPVAPVASPLDDPWEDETPAAPQAVEIPAQPEAPVYEPAPAQPVAPIAPVAEEQDPFAEYAPPAQPVAPVAPVAPAYEPAPVQQEVPAYVPPTAAPTAPPVAPPIAPPAPVQVTQPAAPAAPVAPVAPAYEPAPVAPVAPVQQEVPAYAPPTAPPVAPPVAPPAPAYFDPAQVPAQPVAPVAPVQQVPVQPVAPVAPVQAAPAYAPAEPAYAPFGAEPGQESPEQIFQAIAETQAAEDPHAFRDPYVQGEGGALVPVSRHGAVATPDSGGAKVVFSWAGKGGVGKTSAATALAQIAAENGLRVILIDSNFAQGDIRTYLRIGMAALPSAYNYAVTGDLRQTLIDPDMLTNARDVKQEPVLFGLVTAPPPHLADPAIVTPEVYMRLVADARKICDLVVIDTQIVEAVDNTGMVDRFMVPLMQAGAFGLGVTDLSSAGITNLMARLKRFAALGVPREQQVTFLNRAPHNLAFQESSLTAALGEHSVFLGTSYADSAVPEAQNTAGSPGRVAGFAAFMIATLNQVRPDLEIEVPSVGGEQEAKGKKRFGLFGRKSA